MRFESDGTPDLGFSGSGYRLIEFRPVALAIQSDGKIVAGGSIFNGSNSDFALGRLNLDGSPEDCTWKMETDKNIGTVEVGVSNS